MWGTTVQLSTIASCAHEHVERPMLRLDNTVGCRDDCKVATGQRSFNTKQDSTGASSRVVVYVYLQKELMQALSGARVCPFPLDLPVKELR